VRGTAALLLPPSKEITTMARYIIERQFPKGLSIPQNDEGK